MIPSPALGRHPTLERSDDGVDQRHGNHAAAQERQLANVFIGYGAVDELADQQRRDHRQHRDHENCRQNARQ